MELIFSGKLSFLLFSLNIARKTSDSVLKKRSKLIEVQLTKVVFTSNGLILDIVFLSLTKVLRFHPIIFNRDVHTAISASRWTTSGETSFFGINYQFQFILGFSGLWVWTFSEKKIRTFRTALNVSGGKIGWKNVFFWISFNFAHLFGLWRKHIRIFG